MFDKKDYMASLNKARRKRKQSPYLTYILMAAGILVAVLLVAGIGVLVKKQIGSQGAAVEGPGQTKEGEAIAGPQGALPVEEEVQRAAEESQKAAEEAKEAAKRQAVVDSYENLGMVQASGYLNVRETPDSSSRDNIIGKIQEHAVCEILSQEGDWYHIVSGEVEGYISSQYVITGEEARAQALEEVKLRAVVTADNLNIRSTPEKASDNVVAQALEGERYEVLDQVDGWIQIPSGYISADYAEVKLCLNEARKMDLKAMAINQYHNLVVSKVKNYLNVRSSPKDEGYRNIIGKMPGNAAGEILETTDGWYKIRSGNITGYISADPQYTATGQEAIDLGLSAASLMAIVNTDRLNVRKEPSTDSGIWTQISKEDRYSVVQQLDGWVQIELDTGDEEEGGDAAYIATRDNNVEVRYALPEAIKFSPLEEEANKQSSFRAKIVNYALKFVGNRYVWGGTSLTNGTDCSGFTQSVLRNFGISIPRVSRDQAKAGRAVKSSEMRPGDLIFYTNSSGTINHVAMYIGNGQVVHAASKKSGIKISTWNYRSPAKIRNVID